MADCILVSRNVESSLLMKSFNTLTTRSIGFPVISCTLLSLKC